MQRFKTFIKEGNMGKLGANRGDLAEIILGAAVTARFFHPPQVPFETSLPLICGLL